MAAVFLLRRVSRLGFAIRHRRLAQPHALEYPAEGVGHEGVQAEGEHFIGIEADQGIGIAVLQRFTGRVAEAFHLGLENLMRLGVVAGLQVGLGKAQRRVFGMRRRDMFDRVSEAFLRFISNLRRGGGGSDADQNRLNPNLSN